MLPKIKSLLLPKSQTRWCFQIFLIFTPIWGQKSNLTNIVTLGEGLAPEISIYFFYDFFYEFFMMCIYDFFMIFLGPISFYVFFYDYFMIFRFSWIF